MQKLVAEFVRIKRLSYFAADRIKLQFDNLISLSTTRFNEKFESFDEKEHSLDVFYSDLFKTKQAFPNGCDDLYSLVKDVLILSHGQADVEKGFSINKGMLIENLHEETLVNLRLFFLSCIYDSLFFLTFLYLF